MFADPQQVLEAVRSGFAGRSILVVGDCLLDRYVAGEVSRLSPEAPVPVLRVTSRRENPGGAANVAMNLARLGIRTTLAGVLGADAAGGELGVLLDQAGIGRQALLADPGCATIVKQRVVAGRQQIVRVDDEVLVGAGPGTRQRLQAALAGLLPLVQAVVLSDYAKGTLTAELCQWLIAAARRAGLPVLVDPKGRDWARYRGATTITPNAAELAQVLGVPPTDLTALLAGGARLRCDLELDSLILTRGEAGLVCLGPAGVDAVPAQAREVFDVSGAGDTVIATLAAALAAGCLQADAVRLANVAAGLVVARSGTVPIEREELLDAVRRGLGGDAQGKVLAIPALADLAQHWRRDGATVVFTNGCFDVLHAGHIRCLEQARALGHRLIVGLNSDASVQRLKGPGRPFNCQEDRAVVLAALECVDAVAIFDADTPLELIQLIRPQVLVKGGDYVPAQVVGAAEVAAWGGSVVCVPLVPGRSSTRLVDKMRGKAGPTTP